MHAEANVADSLAAEALFQFSQDFSLANFFALVMHGDWRIPTYAELGRQGRSAEGEAKDSVRRTVRTDAQYRIGNRRCRTLRAMKPKREAVEIAFPCTCATEIRAVGEVPSMRGAPPGRPRLLHCCAK